MGIRLLTILLLLFSAQAQAFTSPLGISVINIKENMYLGFPGPSSNVCGLRLTIFRSVNKNVCGLDLGIIWNENSGDLTGIQIAGIANTVAGNARIFGLQFAGIANIDREVTLVGIQFALLENKIYDQSMIAGLQVALLNIAPRTNIYGAQFGLVNRAGNVHGLQLGILNVADKLTGIQIGLLNINYAGPIKAFIGINAGF